MAITGLCSLCGGDTQQSARIDQFGELANAVFYPRYAMTCLHCGREERADQLRDLNETAAAVARSLSLGILLP